MYSSLTDSPYFQKTLVRTSTGSRYDFLWCNVECLQEGAAVAMGYVSFKGRTKTPCATVSGTDGFGGVRLGKLEKMMGSHPLNEFLRNGRCF